MPTRLQPQSHSTNPRPELMPAIYVVIDAVLCRLQVWSAAQWAALAPADRPASAAFFRGLGWVVAHPEVCLN